jgi:hypothetical protein
LNRSNTTEALPMFTAMPLAHLVQVARLRVQCAHET